MSSLSFREHMAGWVSFDQHDYNQALVDGHTRGIACSYRLQIDVDDVERFVRDSEHQARASGVVSCPQLGGELKVAQGWFNLFVDVDGPRRKRMLYRLLLVDPDGRELTLSGFKQAFDDMPGLHVWSDTSNLLVRLLAGHHRHDPPGDELTIATGILHITRVGTLRMVASFRPSGRDLRERARALARFDELFARELDEVYGRKAEGLDTDAWPRADGQDRRWQGYRPSEWHDLPGNRGLRRQIVGVQARDGFPLTLHHIVGPDEPHRGPVLLAHGCSVRAEMFYGAPTSRTLVDALVERGYDVWIENWRGSIDLMPSRWTLDHAAAHDHPAAVQAVLDHTGSVRCKAVVHCQGSTSFTMAAVAGLLPQVTDVVCNAVSLHVCLTRRSLLKVSTLPRMAAPLLPGLDPQWVIRPPSLIAHGLARWATLVRRGCDSEVCRFSNYAYGVGPEVLWRHVNLTPATHAWVSREWGFCPMTFFEQMARSARAGHLVPVAGLPDIPHSLVDAAPATDARFTFLAGEQNRCFLPVSQQRSFEHFERWQPGRHARHLLPGYGHLDVFFGTRAADEVYPIILGALERGERSPRASAGSAGRVTALKH